MPREIKGYEDIPLPVAKDILERRIKENEVLDIQRKTLNYLTKISKCKPNIALRLVSELCKRFGLRRETSVMIVNIMPSTVDELRTIVSIEEKTFTTEELNEILKVISECKGD